jgi:hypothetical protein
MTDLFSLRFLRRCHCPCRRVCYCCRLSINRLPSCGQSCRLLPLPPYWLLRLDHRCQHVHLCHRNFPQSTTGSRYWHFLRWLVHGRHCLYQVISFPVTFEAVWLIQNSAAPTAFETIGWKYYLIFCILTAINVVIIWMFFPEVFIAFSLSL